MQRLAKELKQLGFAVTEKVGGNGIVGVLKNGAGPTVLVRTDMDALPVEERTGVPYASKVRVRDKNGRVAIPGFYDDVLKLSAYERKEMARLPFKESAYQKFMGVPQLFGEKGFTPNEQRAARPTIEINGLTSGYQGEGSKTIVPSWARAKLTFRLVPNQKPEKILKLVAKHLRKLCPPSVRLEVALGHGGINGRPIERVSSS